MELERRPYQDDTVTAVTDSWCDGSHAPCVALPTGGGKTVIAAKLAAGVKRDAGGRTVMLTDRELLLPQLAETARAIGLTVETVQAPAWKTPPPEVMRADVLVVMAQTAHAREWTPEDLAAACIVPDECHIDRQIVRRWLETGIPACGLSATPLERWMHAGEPPGPWTRLIAPLTTAQMIDDGWLLPPIFREDIPDPSEGIDPLTDQRYARAGEDWSADEAEAIMSPHTQAIAERWRALCDAPASDGGYDGVQPPTLVMASTIDHAGALRDAFRKAAKRRHGKRIAQNRTDGAGLPRLWPAGFIVERSDSFTAAGSLRPTSPAQEPQMDVNKLRLSARRDGQHQSVWRVLSARQTSEETRRVMAAFKAGDVHGLVAVHKITIGVDAPDATIAVAARPTRRLITWAQFVGRTMRKPTSHRGHARVTILDAAGNARRFAARLHRFWAKGPQWPFPAAVAPGGGVGPQDPTPARCPDHPTVLQSQSAQVCCVCYRPLPEPEPPVEDRKRFRADVLDRADVALSVLRLAQNRAIQPPLADAPDRARRWARAQVWTLCGRAPLPGWPSRGWLDADYRDPHPVVGRMIKRNARAYAAWMDEPEQDRPERPEQETVKWR